MPASAFLSRPRTVLLLLGIGSAIALAAAFIAQYGFGFAPCHLCILQRYPHGAVAALGLLGAWKVKNRKRIRLLMITCAVVLLIGLGIAIYHTGIERGWIPGPSGCTSHSSADASIEQLRAEIMNAPLVSCDQPLGDFLGLPLPFVSALIYAFLTILAFIGIRYSLHPDTRT